MFVLQNKMVFHVLNSQFYSLQIVHEGRTELSLHCVVPFSLEICGPFLFFAFQIPAVLNLLEIKISMISSQKECLYVEGLQPLLNALRKLYHLKMQQSEI